MTDVDLSLLVSQIGGTSDTHASCVAVRNVCLSCGGAFLHACAVVFFFFFSHFLFFSISWVLQKDNVEAVIQSGFFENLAVFLQKQQLQQHTV